MKTHSALPSGERALREQRALELGASDARHLCLVANDIEDEGIIELPGVDAARLRLLARKLEADKSENDELRAYAAMLHCALCEAIEDAERAEQQGVAFVFVLGRTLATPSCTLTPAALSDLLVLILDEIE